MDDFEMTDEMCEQMCKDMDDAEEYFENHCVDCDGEKTNKEVDLCFKCAKKKAATLGVNLTPKKYAEGRA